MKAPRPAGAGSALLQKIAQCDERSAHYLGIRRVSHGKGAIDKCWIEILHHEPATRPQRRDQPGENCHCSREVQEDQAGVNEIEGRLRKQVSFDIVAPHLELWRVGGGEPAKEARVKIGGQYVTVGPHLLSEPPGHRAPTRADFETVPAGAKAGCGKTPLSARIVECFQASEALSRSGRSLALSKTYLVMRRFLQLLLTRVVPINPDRIQRARLQLFVGALLKQSLGSSRADRHVARLGPRPFVLSKALRSAASTLQAR